MKYLNILVVLLVAAILFAGCSQQASQTSNPPQLIDLRRIIVGD